MKEHDLLQTIKREGKFGGVGDGSEMSRGGEKSGFGKRKKTMGSKMSRAGEGENLSFFPFDWNARIQRGRRCRGKGQVNTLGSRSGGG